MAQRGCFLIISHQEMEDLLLCLQSVSIRHQPDLARLPPPARDAHGANIQVPRILQIDSWKRTFAKLEVVQSWN